MADKSPERVTVTLSAPVITPESRKYGFRMISPMRQIKVAKVFPAATVMSDSEPKKERLFEES